MKQYSGFDSRRLLTVILMLFFLPVCVFASGQKDAQTTEEVAVEEKVLHLGGGDWGLPSPYRHYRRGPGIFKMHLIYDSLLEIDEKGDIPWLAKSWEVSDDGLTYTFNLQEGVLWHDGTPMRAEDVAFSFEYYREHPPVYTSLFPQGQYVVQTARALDEHTVEITVNARDVTYLSKLGNARIIPKHIWENVSDPTAFTDEGATVGCGPFVLESYSPEQGTYRFAAFDKYWGLPQAVDAIEFVPVSDSVMAFENGDIDLLRAPADLLPRYEDSDEFNVERKPSYHCYRLMMNMETQPEFKDVNLRRALAYALDREDILEKVQRGSGVVSSMGYVWQDSDWYNSDIEPYDFNVEKATELLGGKTYTFDLLTGDSPDDIKAAELIKLNLAQVGIDVTVKSLEFKVRDNAIRTGQYELVLVFYGGMGGDPDFLRSTYYVDPEKTGQGMQTLRGYSNEEINRLAQAQAIEMDPERRKEIIYDLQDVIADEVPMVLVTGTLWNFVYRPATYDGWVFRYGHNFPSHNKLSFLIR